METKTLASKLSEIQSELKAPKDQFNAFGKYKYRSAENILTAVKPLLIKYGLTLMLNDFIEMIGNRYYIRAEVTVTDGIESLKSQAYAREDEFKKGMDGSQVTGASSSYARKYALNGMFAIDDTKDADALNVSKEYTDSASSIDKYITTLDQVRDSDLIAGLKQVAAAKSVAELSAVWKANAPLQADANFKHYTSARKKEVA